MPTPTPTLIEILSFAFGMFVGLIYILILNLGLPYIVEDTTTQNLIKVIVTIIILIILILQLV